MKELQVALLIVIFTAAVAYGISNATFGNHGSTTKNRIDAQALNAVAQTTSALAGLNPASGTYKLDQETNVENILQDEVAAGTLEPKLANVYLNTNAHALDKYKFFVIGYITDANKTKWPVISSAQINQDAGSDDPQHVVDFLKNPND